MEDSAYMSQPDSNFRTTHSDINSTLECPQSTTEAVDYSHPLVIDPVGFHNTGHNSVDHQIVSASLGSSFPNGALDIANLTNGPSQTCNSEDYNAKDHYTTNFCFSPSDLLLDDLDWEARSSQMYYDSITLQELNVRTMQQSPIAQFQSDAMNPYTFQDNVHSDSRTSCVSGVVQRLPNQSVEQRQSQTSGAPPVRSLSYKSGPYVPIRPQVNSSSERINVSLDTHLGTNNLRRVSMPGSSAIRSGADKGPFRNDCEIGSSYKQTTNLAASKTLQTGNVVPNENHRRTSLGSVSGMAIRQLLDEADSKVARTDPLYSIGPGYDGLYHCPFDQSESCGHKPTKLKCNYDKYIDSHLKPFRCRDAACAITRFSSAACLLRHEREAHQMHGAEPHLCHYTGCDRSISGNGFPRKYNLYDHMRRVHEHTEPMTPDHASPPTMMNQVTAKPTTRQPRRRRNSKDADKQAEWRSVHGVSKSIDSGRVTVSRIDDARLKRRKQLQDDWTQRLASLRQNVGTIEGPQDATSLQIINESALKLNQVAQELDKFP